MGGGEWTSEPYQQVWDYPQDVVQAVQMTEDGISLEWNDIILFASHYWWIGVIFLIGLLVTIKVLWGVFQESDNIWIKQLRKQLGWGKK